jgi:alkanesulfonate monooxygenase SsuD/methylene tetrahydromethanopterin reductase-like flavin-dependent oxidoreductase (luciferase family)
MQMWKPEPTMSETACNLEYFMRDVIIAGDPPHVAEQIIALRERIGAFGSLIMVAHDWDDRARWLHSLELFAREVVPIVKRAFAKRG